MAAMTSLGNHLDKVVKKGQGDRERQLLEGVVKKLSGNIELLEKVHYALEHNLLDKQENPAAGDQCWHRSAIRFADLSVKDIQWLLVGLGMDKVTLRKAEGKSKGASRQILQYCMSFAKDEKLVAKSRAKTMDALKARNEVLGRLQHLRIAQDGSIPWEQQGLWYLKKDTAELCCIDGKKVPFPMVITDDAKFKYNWDIDLCRMVMGHMELRVVDMCPPMNMPALEKEKMERPNKRASVEDSGAAAASSTRFKVTPVKRKRVGVSTPTS